MELLNNFFVVLVGVFDIKHEKIALIRRKNHPYQNFWGLVGGKIKEGEDLISAAKREVFEETDTRLINLHFHGVLEEFLYYENNTKLDIFHIFVVSGQTKGDSLNCSEEGLVKWFALTDLDEITIIPSDKLMITKMVLGASNKLRFAKATLQEEEGKVKLLEFKMMSEYLTEKR